MTGTDLLVLEPERIDRMRAHVMEVVEAEADLARRRRRRVRTAVGGGIAAAMVVVAGVGVGITGFGGTTSQDSVIADDSGASAPEPLRGGLQAETDGGTTADDADAPPSIVTTGSMWVDVDDVSAAVVRLRTFVAGADGRVDEETLDGGERGSADLTVRVPAAEVDALRRELEDLGDVSSVSVQRTDVAEQVADVQARIASLEASIDRLRAIIRDAESTKDLLAAEAELSRRQADLEALQARQRVLRDRTSLATITVTLATRDGARPVEPREGFLGGLTRGWNALVDTINATVTVAGLLTPWLLPLGLLAGAAWLVRRRVRR